MNNKFTTTFLMLIFLFSCKNTKEEQAIMDITNKKWLAYDISNGAWKSVIMPTLLDFQNNKVALSFSNSFDNYKLIENNLFINEKKSFNVTIDNNGTHLTLANTSAIRKYIELQKGNFNDFDKKMFDNVLSSNKWVIYDLNAEFKNLNIGLYDNQDKPIKAGYYNTFLYNNAIILFINIDGIRERDIYVVKSFNKNVLNFDKILSDGVYENLNIIPSSPIINKH